MLFVGDGAAPTARVVCAAPRSGVGAVDVAVRDGAQAVKSRAVLARREIDLMAGSGGMKGEQETGTAQCNVIPAKAGIHVWLRNMDPRFRGDDIGCTCRSCFLLSAVCFHFASYTNP
jgi:hypothetical protein